MKYNIRDRVELKELALKLSYVLGRTWYTDVKVGKKGTIIGKTADGTKLAIEFDEPIFTKHTEKRSSHDSGCHGRGKLHYCWYFPESTIKLIDNDCIVSDNDLLLLL